MFKVFNISSTQTNYIQRFDTRELAYQQQMRMRTIGQEQKTLTDNNKDNQHT